jgi:hypothetical protein
MYEERQIDFHVLIAVFAAAAGLGVPVAAVSL